MITPTVRGMIEAVENSLDALRKEITDVEYGGVIDGKTRITFKVRGEPTSAILRGRNWDSVLTDDLEWNASLALRCLIDGDEET